MHRNSMLHDDVIKWKHFLRYWPFVLTCGPPSQWPVTRSFDVFFDMCLNKQLSKSSWRRWFETQSCSLWRHCNGLSYAYGISHDIWTLFCVVLLCLDMITVIGGFMWYTWPYQVLPSLWHFYDCLCCQFDKFRCSQRRKFHRNDNTINVNRSHISWARYSNVGLWLVKRVRFTSPPQTFSIQRFVYNALL